MSKSHIGLAAAVLLLGCDCPDESEEPEEPEGPKACREMVLDATYKNECPHEDHRVVHSGQSEYFCCECRTARRQDEERKR